MHCHLPLHRAVLNEATAHAHIAPHVAFTLADILTKAHAKQQQRQMRSTEDGGVPGEHRNPSKSASSQSPGVLAAAFDASLASSVTDGEETTSTKSRYGCRRWSGGPYL